MKLIQIRPGKSMMAFSVGKTIIQVESGLIYALMKTMINLDYDANGLLE